MKRKGQIIIGLALILIFILMALAAPVLAPNDPNATNLALKNAPLLRSIHLAVTKWAVANYQDFSMEQGTLWG